MTRRGPESTTADPCEVCGKQGLSDGLCIACRPACTSCGQPLLLLAPGRDTCERCRLDGVPS